MSSVDKTAFCNWAVDQLDIAGTCRNLGVGRASDSDGTLQERRELCTSTEQSCLELVPSAELAKECRDDWITDTCRATADELSQCLSKMKENYATAYGGVPACSQLELDSAPATLDVAPFFVGCEDVLAKCPTLFGPDRDSNDPDPAAPAVVQLCQEACTAYSASCGTPCDENCSISRTVYGEACDVQGERFYQCAKTARFDCSKDDLALATKDCGATLIDYLTCYALDGVTCKREPALNTQCEDKPETPFATRCVSDAVPAGCVQWQGAYYCCPSE